MARVILVTVGLLALIGGGSSSLAVSDIPQAEAEAAIESAYGWMACDALNPAGTYDKEDDRCRYLYCGRCNCEPERGVDAYVRETCFMLTYVESRSGAWELSSVQTVDPDRLANTGRVPATAPLGARFPSQLPTAPAGPIEESLDGSRG